MTWTPRPSSQSRKVSRIGRGTVHISSQMITRGTNFCPILSGVHSVWPLQQKLLRDRSEPGRPESAFLSPGGGSGSRQGNSSRVVLPEPRRRSSSSSGASTAGHRSAARRGAVERLWPRQGTDVFRPGEVGRMFLGHKDLLALVAPLARGDRGV